MPGVPGVISPFYEIINIKKRVKKERVNSFSHPTTGITEITGTTEFKGYLRVFIVCPIGYVHISYLKLNIRFKFIIYSRILPSYEQYPATHS